MSTMTLQNLDDNLEARLRARAVEHGHSMEDEVQQILRAALLAPAEPSTGAALVADIRALVEALGGVELQVPLRELTGEPPDFSGPEFDR